MARVLSCSCLLLLLVGCSAPVGPREGTGTLIGAGAGALLGSQVGSGNGQLLATAAGTLIGALLGQDVGQTLDRADQAYLEHTSQDALEYSRTDQTKPWVNPDSGNAGSITPTRTFQDDTGRYCREFTQTIIIDGDTQRAYGTACRQPDGTWKLSAAESRDAHIVVIREPAPGAPVPWRYYHHYSDHRPYFWPFGLSLTYSRIGYFDSRRHHSRWDHNRRSRHEGYSDRHRHRD